MSVSFATTVGVNFSNTFQKKPISVSTAATAIAATGAGVVKMYNYEQTDFIQDAKSKGLQVIIGIPNEKLADLSANKASALSAVVDVVKTYADTIIMVCVGNEPLAPWKNGKYTASLVPAIQNLQTALEAANAATPLTVPFNYAIMGNSYPPSAGVLNSDLTSTIKDVCKVIKSSGAVFMINIYPFLDITANPTKITLPYCLFTSTSVVVQDGSYGYKCIFDASYDALSIALTAIGYGDLQIVVGECGWPSGPTDEYPITKTPNPETFNKNLITHCQSGNGTPRHPNMKIQCFIFEMYDEELKDTSAGDFEISWGICDNTGKAKYSITIS